MPLSPVGVIVKMRMRSSTMPWMWHGKAFQKSLEKAFVGGVRLWWVAEQLLGEVVESVNEQRNCN